jgi:hypothetical protein
LRLENLREEDIVRPLTTTMTNHDAGIDEEVQRFVRSARAGGVPMDADVRHAFEGSVAESLDAVRLHRGADVDRITDAIGVDAFASAADVFVHGRAHLADGTVPAWLLAHELAHGGQQATRGDRVPADSSAEALESAADLIADQFVGGGRPAFAAAVRSPSLDGHIVLQGHASWEHRLLGETWTSDIYKMIPASASPERMTLLKALQAYLGMWQTNPLSVTAEMVLARYPYMRTYTLQPSNVLVTYGELTTLPDYFADAEAMSTQPQDIFLKVIQAVRQEGYNKISRLIDPTSKPVKFENAVAINTGWDFIDLLIETMALDKLTWDLGPDHTDHYTALVGRNACHFAPYAWYRWRDAFFAAQDYAGRAYAATEPGQKTTLTNLAWMSQGYAEHFLQDSFAAGHLVNKTLVMQWFVEWAATNISWHIADWDNIVTMVEGKQPYIAAPDLYNWTNPGVVRDPQTVTQGGTLQDRIAMSGVIADGGNPIEQSYQNFWMFLHGTVGQSASGVLHDHFNKTSLTVASEQHPTPYQVYGDDTMLKGDGAWIGSEASMYSQTSINDLLTTGTTQWTVDRLFTYFPTSVAPLAGGSPLPIETWQNSAEIRSLAQSLFPGVHWRWLTGKPRIGYISQDLKSQVALTPA